LEESNTSVVGLGLKMVNKTVHIYLNPFSSYKKVYKQYIYGGIWRNVPGSLAGFLAGPFGLPRDFGIKGRKLRLSMQIPETYTFVDPRCKKTPHPQF